MRQKRRLLFKSHCHLLQRKAVLCRERRKIIDPFDVRNTAITGLPVLHPSPRADDPGSETIRSRSPITDGPGHRSCGGHHSAGDCVFLSGSSR
jgi:hypothetical protein